MFGSLDTIFCSHDKRRQVFEEEIWWFKEGYRIPVGHDKGPVFDPTARSFQSGKLFARETQFALCRTLRMNAAPATKLLVGVMNPRKR